MESNTSTQHQNSNLELTRLQNGFGYGLNGSRKCCPCKLHVVSVGVLTYTLLQQLNNNSIILIILLPETWTSPLYVLCYTSYLILAVQCHLHNGMLCLNKCSVEVPVGSYLLSKAVASGPVSLVSTGPIFPHLWLYDLCLVQGKVLLCHTTLYCTCIEKRVVWHLHDICVVHIRWNSVHGHPKLLVVKWLVLSVTFRVSIKARDREWIVLFFCLS